MARGVGIDLAEVARFSVFAHHRSHPFLVRTYSSAELAYCFAFRDPAPHLAGIFAAKEAVFKALGRKDLSLSLIRIGHAEDGRPLVFVKGRRRAGVLVSITHTHRLAAAIALVS